MKSIDKVWEEIHNSGGWGQYPSEHVIRFVARNYYSSEDRKQIRILDYGCGQGAHTWYLAREGFDTYAFDGSESAVRKTKKRFEDEKMTASFKVADAMELDYPDSFFDAIIDNVCIYANRIDNIKYMYKEVYRMLKPGGKLLTVCFGEETDGYKTGKEIEPGTFIEIKEGMHKDRGLMHIFKRDEIVSMLENNGFKNVQCEWSKFTDKGNMIHHYICTGEK